MGFQFDPASYGRVAAELLAAERVPALGPGSPNAAARALLEAATVERLFAHARVADAAMADACRSGLWLYHDYLKESHVISQSISTPTGSCWHGIMHRREPDFSNAKYWFRRVGAHPVFPRLAEAAREIASAETGLEPAAWLAAAGEWEPFAFVDACEECYQGPEPDHTVCRRISLAEWQLLFDHAYRLAVGEA